MEEIKIPENCELEKQTADDICLFEILPEDLTSGTAYDYYQKFPGFDEEIYYLLQFATRNDAEKDVMHSR